MLNLPPLHNHEYHGNQRGTGRQERRSAEKWLSTKYIQAGTLLTEGGVRDQPPVLLPGGAGLQEGVIPSNSPAWGNLLSWWWLVGDSRKWNG